MIEGDFKAAEDSSAQDILIAHHVALRLDYLGRLRF
jgi:hypothetical protein